MPVKSRFAVGLLAATFGIALTGISAHASIIPGFSTATFTGDGNSGISTANTYTHAVNFGKPGALTINGVTFAAGTSGDQTGTLGYDLEGTSGLLSDFSGPFVNNLSGQTNKLAQDFYYTTGTTETLELTGLTSGTTYQTTFYGVGTDAAGDTRVATISDGLGHSIVYDQDAVGQGNGTLLSDTFTATGDSITFTFANNVANDSVQQFGFSNQTVVPEPASLSLLGIGAMGLLARRRRRAGR